MQTRRKFITRLALAAGMAKPWLDYGAERGDVLAPCGKTHIPIGIDNTLDTLKTFV
jgi:hypothetical protein